MGLNVKTNIPSWHRYSTFSKKVSDSKKLKNIWQSRVTCRVLGSEFGSKIYKNLLRFSFKLLLCDPILWATGA
jgi:hypothetical protein